MPGIVPVANSSIIRALRNINRRNPIEGRDPSSCGIFSTVPGSTPKYAQHRKRDGDNLDTLARMFIPVPPSMYDAFVASAQDPDTQSILRVLAGDGSKVGGRGYIDFMLQEANHSLQEKVQVSETLNDNYVAFYFGTNAPMWSYQGTLMNTYQDDWTIKMFKLYSNMIRGTELARHGVILKLRYDSMIVTGSLVGLNWSLRAGSETWCPFGFTLLVQKVTVPYGSLVGPTELPSNAYFAPAGYVMDIPHDKEQMKTYIQSPEPPEGALQTVMTEPFPWEQSLDYWDDSLGITTDTGLTLAVPEDMTGSLQMSTTGNEEGRIKTNLKEVTPQSQGFAGGGGSW
jgi:hypothetical protein